MPVLSISSTLLTWVFQVSHSRGQTIGSLVAMWRSIFTGALKASRAYLVQSNMASLVVGHGRSLYTSLQCDPGRTIGTNRTTRLSASLGWAFSHRLAPVALVLYVVSAFLTHGTDPI